MSKIDEVMKAWQEDRKEVSWSDLQAIKAENEALRAQIGQGVPVNGEWVERWHGSKTDEGWSILFQSLVPRDKVAYLGTGVSTEAVQSIVYAHNQALSAQQQQPLTDEPEIAACGLMPLIEDYAIAVKNGDENSGTVLKKIIEASLEELESQQQPLLDEKKVEMSKLTDEQIVAAYCKERRMWHYVEAYLAGARFAEAAHHIGEKK